MAAILLALNVLTFRNKLTQASWWYWIHYSKWVQQRSYCTFNTLRVRQNGCHFPDNIFKSFSWMKILIKISLKFVPKGPINTIPSLVQIMAWCRPGDKPFTEPMMVNLLTHKYVTRPQWVKLKKIFFFSNSAMKSVRDLNIVVIIVIMKIMMVLWLPVIVGWKVWEGQNHEFDWSNETYTNSALIHCSTN